MTLRNRKKLVVFISIMIIAAVGIIGIEKTYAASRKKDRNKNSQQVAKAQNNETKVNEKKNEDSNESSKDEKKNGKADGMKVETTDYDSPQQVKIPVLMYHSIAYEKNNELRVPKEKFEEQMKWLHDNGYAAMSLDELHDCLTTGKKVPKKPVVITFDDGYRDNYDNAFPILKKYNMKATVFMITDSVDNSDDKLSSKQLKEMQENGVDIESHTSNHVELNTESSEKQKEVLLKSKQYLDKLLNKDTKYLCYPVGKYNEATLKAAQETGYKLAFTTKPGFSKVSDGMYTLHRVRINASYGLSNFKALVEIK